MLKLSLIFCEPTQKSVLVKNKHHEKHSSKRFYDVTKNKHATNNVKNSLIGKQCFIYGKRKQQ